MKNFFLSRILKRKYPLVMQYDQKDCGPAVLLSVLRYYSGNSNLPNLRELCHTNTNGSTMLDIVNSAKTLGLEARGAQGEYEDLQKEKMPCIAHVIVDDRLTHFIVLYKIKDDKIFVGDPGKGKYWLSKAKFLKIWKSKSVVLLKPSLKVVNQKTLPWYNWLYSYLRKEKIWIYQSLFLGVIYTVLGLTIAFFVQLLLDKFIPDNEYVKIIYSGIFLAAILVIKSFASYFRQRFLIVLNKNINTNINADFLEHLFKLPKNFFDSRKTGDITARVNDAIKIQNSIVQVVGVSIIDMLVVIGSIVMMFYFTPLLAILSLVLLPIYGIILILNMNKLKRGQHDVMKGYAQVESMYINSLEGVDEIMSFNAGGFYSKVNKYLFSDFQEKIKNLGFTQAGLSLLAELFGSLAIISLLTVGALFVINGDFLVGEMIAAYSLLANIIPCVNRLVNTNLILQETSIASTRLMDMLLVNEEIDGGNKPFQLQKKLSIQNGFFSWNKRDYLFANLNIDLKVGQITSLWGKSGSGKSTLVKILQRKYDLSRGQILVDGTKSESINLFQYRQGISVVPQAIKVFNGSIAENILLGRNITDEFLLEEAIIELGLKQFYLRFEFGLATLIGENGRALSGGELQILALTRALLYKPNLLIVDEGLSGIDIEFEKIIFDILKKYSISHAVFLITHNLDSIEKTDYTYVLENGKILQHGTPNKLLTVPGYFKELWEFKKTLYEKKIEEVVNE